MRLIRLVPGASRERCRRPAQQDRSQRRSVMAGKVKAAEFPAAAKSPGLTS
jgi:hypothetical protein